MLIVNFKKVYKLESVLSVLTIDESIVSFCDPLKVSKVCSLSGYTHNLQVYCGTVLDRNCVVLILMDD